MGPGRSLSASWLIVVLILALVACSQTSGTARGPVASVEGDLIEVTSFSVVVEGDTWDFIPVEDGEYAFPLPHLREHQRTGEPVLIGWELVDDVRYAVSVEDG